VKVGRVSFWMKPFLPLLFMLHVGTSLKLGWDGMGPTFSLPMSECHGVH